MHVQSVGTKLGAPDSQAESASLPKACTGSYPPDIRSYFAHMLQRFWICVSVRARGEGVLDDRADHTRSAV